MYIVFFFIPKEAALMNYYTPFAAKFLLLASGLNDCVFCAV